MVALRLSFLAFLQVPGHQPDNAVASVLNLKQIPEFPSVQQNLQLLI